MPLGRHHRGFRVADGSYDSEPSAMAAVDRIVIATLRSEWSRLKVRKCGCHRPSGRTCVIHKRSMTIFLLILIVETLASALLIRVLVNAPNDPSSPFLRAIWVPIVTLAALLSPTFLDMLANSASYAFKFGRIVDVSGNGLSDVVVAEKVEYSTESLVHGGGGGELYRSSTRTDENGYFFLPAHWDRLMVCIPLVRCPNLAWRLTAFRVGFVNPNDESNGAVINRAFLAASSLPTSIWLALGLRMQATTLVKENLNAVEAASYYASAADTAASPGDIQEIPALLANKICAVDGPPTIDYWVINAISHTNRNANAFLGRLAKLEPQNARATVYDHAVFLTGDVCESLRAALDLQH
jgi:hypothetical protein